MNNITHGPTTDTTERRLLLRATATVGAVVGAATVIPFVASLAPNGPNLLARPSMWICLLLLPVRCQRLRGVASRCGYSTALPR